MRKTLGDRVFLGANRGKNLLLAATKTAHAEQAKAHQGKRCWLGNFVEIAAAAFRRNRDSCRIRAVRGGALNAAAGMLNSLNDKV